MSLTQPINETLIRNFLRSKPISKKNLDFYLFPSINSTNRFLKELKISDSLAICCAETQTQGRGRQNRAWVSPYGENIYCSSRWQLNCNLAELSGLSLVIGLAILASLNEIHPNLSLQLKWPNDIFWQTKKLGGILIEMTEHHFKVIDEKKQDDETGTILTHYHADKKAINIIIGIGLNINTDTKNQSLFNKEKPWCSLYEITDKHFDRNLIIASLIHQLDEHINRFLQSGFEVFMTQWQEVDFLYGKSIICTQGKNIIEGRACGVNHLGHLAVKTEMGQYYSLSSGDTSVRYI